MALLNKSLFDHLFVLELANNHLGQLDRGLKIIERFGTVAKENQIRAAIKLQFRDVAHYVHRDFYHCNNRYIQRTLSTQLQPEEFCTLVAAIIDQGCMPMATPFDEPSVDLCTALKLPIIKIASSSINDWPLLNKIATTQTPVIISTGGASLEDIDRVVSYFNQQQIPLAINHCVSLYPSEDHELELNQIDFLKQRYPHNAIGFSTHEYHDWSSSMLIAYAKGARLFERHIDIDSDNQPVSKYCSLPEQVDTWFKAFKKAQILCGGPSEEKRQIPQKEVQYLDGLVRGIYAKRDLPAGYQFSEQTLASDIEAIIPLQKSQLSC